MRIIDGNIYYSTYDEEPNCIDCIHVTDDAEKYCDRCGPECGWKHYVREKSILEVDE